MSGRKEVRITGVPNKVHEELTNIAKNQGMPLGTFLKPYLRKITEEFPEQMKKRYDD